MSRTIGEFLRQLNGSDHACDRAAHSSYELNF